MGPVTVSDGARSRAAAASAAETLDHNRGDALAWPVLLMRRPKPRGVTLCRRAPKL